MVTLAEGKKHIIIKRDGRQEPYNEEKLRKVTSWATNHKDAFTNKLLTDLNVKINNKMKITDLYDALINTAVNNISPLYTEYDEIAERLYLMKIYKETYGLKKTGQYPHLSLVLTRGVTGGVYNKDFINSFTHKEIEILNSFIEPDRDFLFTYKALNIFFTKYCKTIKNKKLELPQITYMVAAMYSFYNDDKKTRLKHIKETYDMLSLHQVTFATPRIMNSGYNNSQLASCVLNTPDDDTWSLNQTDSNIALYSKFSGGIAYDVSNIRASGSKIASFNGTSDGPVPFIKRVEQTISAFNQQSKRKGSCVITFPFWHYDVQDMIMLKDAGGTEDSRARKLMYSIRIHNIFKERVEHDGDITLFDPKETPLLNSTYGKEFEKAYIYYETKPGIRKKTIKAKDLLYLILKIRTESGNLYLTFVDNINEQSVLNTFVGASNLCTEVLVPSSSSKLISEKLYLNEDNEYEIHQVKKSGEIGICNLCSINLISWYNMSEKEKSAFSYTLLRGCDNIIDTQFYPVKEGEAANKKNRPIGIGVLNYANLLAKNKIKFTEDKAKEFTNSLFDDLYFHLYSAACTLAKERGAYPAFKDSKWCSGKTPFHLSLFDYKSFNLKVDKKKWNRLSDDIKTFGIRFSYVAAIAPTATSGKSINATESIEPVMDLFYMEEGIQNLPTLVANIKENRMYYERCWDIPAKTIIELAAIRQKYIDQAQSITLYYKKPESAKALWEDIKYAMELGIKTLYYMKTPKANFNDEEICESCS